jgi:hypothetical protein
VALLDGDAETDIVLVAVSDTEALSVPEDEPESDCVTLAVPLGENEIEAE